MLPGEAELIALLDMIHLKCHEPWQYVPLYWVADDLQAEIVKAWTCMDGIESGGACCKEHWQELTTMGFGGENG
jgi:hypothetical protein